MRGHDGYEQGFARLKAERHAIAQKRIMPGQLARAAAPRDLDRYLRATGEAKAQASRRVLPVPATEAATAAALERYTGPVAVMSFNPHSVARMAVLAPQVPRGLTTSAYDPEDWSPLPEATCTRLRGIPDYDRSGASFVSHEAADLARPRAFPRRVRRARRLRP